MAEYEPMFDFLKAKPVGNESQDITNMRTQSNERSLLAGATPALVGLLMGDVGVGAEVGGKMILDEDARVQKQQSEYMKALAKKKEDKETLKRRYSYRPIEDDSGNTVLAQVDSFTGEIKPTEHIAGYSKKFRVDPSTGEMVTGSSATGKLAPSTISGERVSRPFNVKEEKDIKQMKDKLMSDPEFKRARSGVNASNRAVELLKLGNPVSDEGIKTVFPRMFGEVGNLAVQEQERFSGSPALGRKFENLKEKWLEGTITDENRTDLIEVAQAMFEYDKGLLDRVAGSHTESLSRQTGIATEKAKGVIDPFTKAKLERGAIKKRIKKDFSLKLTGEDKSAYEWAIKNKRDPRAKRIIEMLKSGSGE